MLLGGELQGFRSPQKQHVGAKFYVKYAGKGSPMCFPREKSC